MKIISLNIRHGGGKRITDILDYLNQQATDVIVLTEYRENANSSVITSELQAAGYIHSASASVNAKDNSVFIASKIPFVAKSYSDAHPQTINRVISAEFEGLTIYGVYFPQKQAKAEVFEFFINGHHQASLPHMVLGDFNTGFHKADEVGSTFYCTAEFQEMLDSGFIDSWRSRYSDVCEYSWFSNAGNGFRIDHVVSSSEADKRISKIYYDHVPRETKLTDHSAMVIEYDS